MYGDPIHPDPSSNLLTSWPTTPNGQCPKHGAIAFATNGKSSSWMMRILKIYQNMSYSGRRSSSILWVVFLTVLSPPDCIFWHVDHLRTVPRQCTKPGNCLSNRWALCGDHHVLSQFLRSSRRFKQIQHQFDALFSPRTDGAFKVGRAKTAWRPT